jgi:hypothetical protein
MERASYSLLHLNRKPTAGNTVGSVQNEFQGRKVQSSSRQIKCQRNLILQQIVKQCKSKVWAVSRSSASSVLRIWAPILFGINFWKYKSLRHLVEILGRVVGTSQGFYLCLLLLLLLLLPIGVCVKHFVSFQFLNLRQSVRLLGRGISPTQGRYLTWTQNKHRYPCLRWDSNPTISVIGRVKTVHSLDREVTVVGNYPSIQRYTFVVRAILFEFLTLNRKDRGYFQQELKNAKNF